MSSTSESGHAINLANFGSMISFISGYGTDYNPTNPALKLASMKVQLGKVKSAFHKTNQALAAYKNAVSERSVAFQPFSALVTRVINALRATDTSVQIDETAKSLVNKVRGTRVSPKKTESEKLALAAEGKVIKEISSAQTSFDSRLDHFDKLVKPVASIPQYVPNEHDLKVLSLTNLYNDLYAKNTAVINAAIALSNARIARNKLLYKPDSGLVDTALNAKIYIKSLYGVSSPQYKQVSGISFRSQKL